MMTDKKEPWHLDKRIPVALIITIIAQGAGVLWFFSKLDSRVFFLETSRPALIEAISKSDLSSNNQSRRNDMAIRALETSSRSEERRVGKECRL